MAGPLLYDRVQDTSATTGTGTLTLNNSPPTGYQSFSVVGNGNTCYYGASDASGNWEVGIGTYSSTGPTLARTTILASSNSGSAVSFASTVTVWVDAPAAILPVNDMLSSFALAENDLTNPSAAALSVNTWNVISASSACNAKLPAPAAKAVVGVRITPGSTNLFTLNPHSSENIDGYSSRIMWAGESAVLVSDGTNWYKVAGKSIPMTCVLTRTTDQSLPQTTNTTIVMTTQTAGFSLMFDSTDGYVKLQRPGNYTASVAGYFNGITGAVYASFGASGTWQGAVAGYNALVAVSGVSVGGFIFNATGVASDPILFNVYLPSSTGTMLGAGGASLWVTENPTW